MKCLTYNNEEKSRIEYYAYNKTMILYIKLPFIKFYYKYCVLCDILKTGC